MVVGIMDLNDSKKINDMPLLSKLLVNDRNIPDIKEYDFYNKFYAYLQKEVQPLLAESPYARKVELWKDIENIFNHLEFGLQWPDLLERKMIGIMPLGKGDQVEACFQVLKDFVVPEVWYHLQLNHNVTSLLVPAPSFPGIRFMNTAWHIDKLSNKEYRGTTHELWKKKIEIGQLLECFVFGNAISNCKHLAFTWLPMYRNQRLPLYKVIFENLDNLVIFPPKTESSRTFSPTVSMKKSLELCAQKGIPVTIVISNPQQETLLQDLPKQTLDMVSTITLRDLPAFLRKEDVPCCHYHYTMHLRKTFYDVERDAFRKQKECHEDMTQIKQDLNFLTQSDTRNQILRCRLDMQKEFDEQKQNMQKFCQALEGLFYGTTQLENQLKAYSKGEEGSLRFSDAFLLAQLAREYIETGRLQEAREVHHLLEKANFPYAYVLQMLMQKQCGITISREELTRLKQENDNEFIRHAKIALFSELGLFEREVIQIAQCIRKPDTPAEWYYRGVYNERMGAYYKAADLYKYAYSQGYQPAAKGIMRLTQAGNGISLKSAANAMVSDACLLYGKTLQQREHYAKADVYFKIAAGNENVEAIDILARNLWNKIRRNYYVGITDKEMEVKLNNCRRLFEYLHKRYPDDESIVETLGFIHLKRGDGLRAFEAWNTCHTKEAYYQCGRLYEYGEGAFSQNLNNASKFYEKAAALGHQKAIQKYKRVQDWMEKKKRQEQSMQSYKSTDNYETKTTRQTDSNAESDSGCFITTAVCRALHKGDECEELMAMRYFRDDMQEADPLMKEMICEYYRVAPKIIERIEESGQADRVYQQIWKSDLNPILRYLKNHEYRQAALGYIAMVERLSRQYDVPFQPGIEQDIASYRQRVKR